MTRPRRWDTRANRESLGRPLTPREWEVLAALANATGNQATADELGISLQTVKNIAHAAYTKLGVTSLIQACRLLGWLRVPAPDEVERQETTERLILELRGIQREATRLLSGLRAVA